MSRWSDDFPKDITNKYYTLWNNNRADFSNYKYSLNDIFVLPDLSDSNGCLVDVEKIFLDIANGEKSLIAITGNAGSGKTALISYLCNSPIISGTDTGIMVWTLPASNDFIRIVMGECNRYAKENEKKRMILVFENTLGLKINQEEIFKTISQRQKTRYPHISVIITYRNNNAISSNTYIETLSIQPFSKEKVQTFIARYSAFNKVPQHRCKTILPLINKLDIEVIGNPVILTLLLKQSQEIDISTNEDIYFLLIGAKIGKQTHRLLEAIAFLMFTMKKDYIPEESLYGYLKQSEKKTQEIDTIDLKPREIKASLKETCIFEDNHISFIHRSLYDYSLASYLATILYRLYRDKYDRTAIRELYKLFMTDKLNEYTIKFIESKIKNNDIVPAYRLINPTEELVSMYLTGKLNLHLCSDNHNIQSSFLPQFQIEMNLFYNFITLYHVVLKTTGSEKMSLLLYSNNAYDAFMYYLRLFSVSENKNELDLSGLDFSNYNFSGIVLKRINLSACNLRNCMFKYSKLENVILKGADLHNSDLSCAQLHTIDLSYTNMQNTNCSESIFLNSSLFSSNLNAADLCHCSLKHVDCRYTNFHLANLDSVICLDGNFSYANFSKTILRNAVLNDSTFEKANFNESIIE